MLRCARQATPKPSPPPGSWWGSHPCCSAPWAERGWAPWSRPRQQRWRPSRRCLAAAPAAPRGGGGSGAGRGGPSGDLQRGDISGGEEHFVHEHPGHGHHFKSNGETFPECTKTRSSHAGRKGGSGAGRCGPAGGLQAAAQERLVR